jgi:hypothetical protein
MDLMDDEDLKKSVIGQMMGELDGVTSDSLKKSAGPVKGVEIAITVSPKSGEEEAEEMPGAECDAEGCEDPMHDHGPKEEEPENSDYISQLMKKLG